MAKHPPAWATALTVVSLWLAGCASAPAPAQTPVITLPVTLLAPTATVVPLTATPVPPTVTPTVAPTPAASPASALQAALLKTSAAESYRIEISMTGSGQPFAALSGDDTSIEVPLMTISGAYSRQSASFTMSGLATAILGSGHDGVELIVADGKTYLRGPAPMLGATDNGWHILPQQQASVAQAPLGVAQLLRHLGGAEAGAFQFDNEGSQEWEGRPCDAHRGDASATRAALASFGANIAPGAGSLSLQTGEFRLWACDDGYVHRLQMRFELSSADDPSRVIVFKAEVRLFDHGADIQISAPPDATPLALPGLTPVAP